MYNELILDHHAHPQYYGNLKDADFRKTLRNASCGDELTIALKIKDDKIIDARFEGVGCAISRASADMMLEMIVGKTIRELKELEELFSGLLVSGSSDKEELKDLCAFSNIAHMPARVNCAKLPWKIVEYF